MKNVRVRFAPSPTGPLHIGGVRTALYNYLFAKKHNGTFILRIEDTDQERFVKGAEEYIINSLTWAGIVFDEGVHVGGPYAPYRQSERKAIYKQFALDLIKKGHAYYAFDTIEDLKQIHEHYANHGKSFQYDSTTRDSMKNSLTLGEEKTKELLSKNIPFVIRFKVPENRNLKLYDLIRGTIEINTNVLDDKVLLKSDGMPTYHLANVVDDYLMKITHVIRGEEWLPSYPLHFLLYEAFGWLDVMPQFAHLPLILKPEGHGKLSKRDGDKHGFPVYPCQWENEKGEKIIGFKEWGFLPEAFINMIALIGWNPGNNKEIMSLEEMIEEFSLDKINKAGGRFDPEKAKWFNHQYIQKTDNTTLLKLIKNYNTHYNVDDHTLLKIIELTKNRINILSEFFIINKYFFEPPTSYNTDLIQKKIKSHVFNHLLEIIKCFNNIKWEKLLIEEAIKNYCQLQGVRLGDLMTSLRIAIVGDASGPHLTDIMEIIGKTETISRIQNFFEFAKTNLLN
ncbi:MAG: glutamate--tRNA ligase [Bacteroidales bacterium]|nr:glutamate--tRNA ligase [Bacteroidales bacterium]